MIGEDLIISERIVTKLSEDLALDSLSKFLKRKEINDIKELLKKGLEKFKQENNLRELIEITIAEEEILKWAYDIGKEINKVTNSSNNIYKFSSSIKKLLNPYGFGMGFLMNSITLGLASLMSVDELLTSDRTNEYVKNINKDIWLMLILGLIGGIIALGIFTSMVITPISIIVAEAVKVFSKMTGLGSKFPKIMNYFESDLALYIDNLNE